MSVTRTIIFSKLLFLLNEIQCSQFRWFCQTLIDEVALLFTFSSQNHSDSLLLVLWDWRQDYIWLLFLWLTIFSWFNIPFLFYFLLYWLKIFVLFSVNYIFGIQYLLCRYQDIYSFQHVYCFLNIRCERNMLSNLPVENERQEFDKN